MPWSGPGTCRDGVTVDRHRALASGEEGLGVCGAAARGQPGAALAQERMGRRRCTPLLCPPGLPMGRPGSGRGPNRRAPQVGLMAADELAILGGHDVALDEVRPILDGGPLRLGRVLRVDAAQAAVGCTRELGRRESDGHRWTALKNAQVGRLMGGLRFREPCWAEGRHPGAIACWTVKRAKQESWCRQAPPIWAYSAQRLVVGARWRMTYRLHRERCRGGPEQRPARAGRARPPVREPKLAPSWSQLSCGQPDRKLKEMMSLCPIRASGTAEFGRGQPARGMELEFSNCSIL